MCSSRLPIRTCVLFVLYFCFPRVLCNVLIFIIPQAKCPEPQVVRSSNGGCGKVQASSVKDEIKHLKFNKNYSRSISKNKRLSTLVNLFFPSMPLKIKLFYCRGCFCGFPTLLRGKTRVDVDLSYFDLQKTVRNH